MSPCPDLILLLWASPYLPIAQRTVCSNYSGVISLHVLDKVIKDAQLSKVPIEEYRVSSQIQVAQQDNIRLKHF